MPPLARLGAQDPREGGQTIQLKLRLIEETGTLLLSGGQEPPESWGGDGCWGGKVLSLSQRLHLPSLSGKAQPPAARTSFPRESPSPTQRPENVYRGQENDTLGFTRTSSPALLTSAIGLAPGPL